MKKLMIFTLLFLFLAGCAKNQSKPNMEDEDKKVIDKSVAKLTMDDLQLGDVKV